MKYVSIDIETTGLMPRACQVLEVAMVLEDTEDPKPINELPGIVVRFRHGLLLGQLEALQMNMELLELCKKEGYRDHGEAWGIIERQLLSWGFNEAHRAVAAGKNVSGFDLQFMPENIRAYFHHRCLDPGSVYVDWSKDTLPSLKDLLGEEPKHSALEDALAVIRVLRRRYMD
jgi:oligoribonuclease (3'-5' exoribonuclease)